MAEEKKVNTNEQIEAEAGAATAAIDENDTDNNRTVKLSKPLNGRVTIIFDYDKIKGSTLLKCEKKTKDIDSSVVVPQLSMIFQAHVAAAALGMRYDDIINLPAPDFMAVTLKVSRFLNGAD